MTDITLTKAQAKRVIKLIGEFRKLITECNALTDEVLARDERFGNDGMQTAFWQNFQYMADSVEHFVGDAEDLIYTANEAIS